MILSVFALLCVGIGLWKKTDVYAAFTEGAKQGLKTAVSILPALVLMLGAVKALEASGLTQAFCRLIAPATEKMGVPGEVVPLMLLRPVSGTASMAALKDVMVRTGPDSRASLLAGVMMGTSETVLYTCSVYLSAAGVKRSRHAVPCALAACLAGYLGAFWFCP